MAKQFSFGNGLLRAMLLLAFLSGLVTAALSSQAATVVPPNRSNFTASKTAPAGLICKGDSLCFKHSEATLPRELEIGLLKEFGVAFEDDDSIEMLRVDRQQCIGGIDWVEPGPSVASKGASYARLNISPPLLV